MFGALANGQLFVKHCELTITFSWPTFLLLFLPSPPLSLLPSPLGLTNWSTTPVQEKSSYEEGRKSCKLFQDLDCQIQDIPDVSSIKALTKLRYIQGEEKQHPCVPLEWHVCTGKGGDYPTWTVIFLLHLCPCYPIKNPTACLYSFCVCRGSKVQDVIFTSGVPTLLWGQPVYWSFSMPRASHFLWDILTREESTLCQSVSAELCLFHKCPIGKKHPRGWRRGENYESERKHSLCKAEILLWLFKPTFMDVGEGMAATWLGLDSHSSQGIPLPP